MSATPDSEPTTTRRRSSPRPEGWVDANLALPVPLIHRLEEAANERAIGVHVLAEMALADWLERLVPVDELVLVRPRHASGSGPATRAPDAS